MENDFFLLLQKLNSEFLSIFISLPFFKIKFLTSFITVYCSLGLAAAPSSEHYSEPPDPSIVNCF